MNKFSTHGLNVCAGLFLVGLLLSTMIVLCTASSIPKPAVPEFTVQLVVHPYDVPPTITTTIDQYTGKETTIAHPGYHVENKTTEIRIKNQPFTPYLIRENDASWTINLFYNIHIKGHFSQNWGYYHLYNGSSDGNLVQDYNSEYTVVPIDSYLPTEGEIDFQVESLIGYEHGVNTVPGVPGTPRVITGEASGWSETQTITIPASTQSPENSSSPTSTPNQTSQTLQLAAIIGTIIAIVVVSAALLIYSKKRMNDRQPKRTYQEILTKNPSITIH